MAGVTEKTSASFFSAEELVRMGQWSTLLRELLKGKGDLWNAADEALFARLQHALHAAEIKNIAG
ncbi:hypothetical protein [Mixta intestinalis]|nr:hypothetical protein [Mixta intestinalis]